MGVKEFASNVGYVIRYGVNNYMADIIIGLGVAGLLTGAAILDSNINESRRLEIERLTPLITAVQKKARKGDDIFTFEEQVRFLRDVGYERPIKEGEAVKIGLRKDIGFYVRLGENYLPNVTEKTFRDYLTR
jgi:hypothetical protein|tara:strand:- start:3046 stop:3441 length:396 start_codon:yes stop_codon:yes gene_type:complete